MEDLLANAFSTGDIKIVVVAAILYFVINAQRKSTKTERDNTSDSFDKRLTLVEHDVNALKDEHKAFGEKLDSIIDILTQKYEILSRY